MKKILTFIIIIAMTLSLGVPAFAATPATVTVVSPTAAVNPGNTVDVAVTIADNPGMDVMKLKFSYDTAALTLKDIELGSVMTGTFTKNLDKAVALLEAAGTTNATGNGTLVTLKFEVKSTATAGNYTIDFLVADAVNRDEERVALTTQAGTVSVAAPVTTYTVKFNANGGTGTMADVTGVPTGTYTLPANSFTAPAGKQFKGWSTGATGAVIAGTTYNVTGDVTLYAIWEEKEAQDTLNITSATTVTYGQTLTLTSEGGSGSGEVAYVVTNGTGEATLEGNVLTPSKVGTVTVVATKAGDATYSSISSAPVVITIEKIKVAIPAEDTTTYTYNGTEQTYQIAENAAYTITGNKQTNANTTGYTVTVKLNNTETHAWSDDSIKVKNYTFIIGKATITVAAKNQQVYVNGKAPVLGTDDYTVTGLVNGETLKTAPTIEYETTPDTRLAGSVIIKVYGAEAPEGGNYNEVVHTNGTLTIKKRPTGGGSIGVSKYTVNFETNGGSEVENKTVNRNAVLKAPKEPTKYGFKFDGWFTDKELTIAYDLTTKVTKDFTLYAKWTEIEKEPEGDKPKDDDSETTEWKNPFNDVKADDWFYANVQYVVENKLMNGVAVDKFAPNDTLTRAMLVTVLYRNEGEPAVNKSMPFADVDMGAYYASAVIWAKQNGIVNGVTKTEFAPDEKITREQIAAIMFRYAQYKGMEAVTLEENLHFDDANEISEYAVSAMNWAVGKGLMKGKSATTINPKDNATRAEIAAILQRYIEETK